MTDVDVARVTAALRRLPDPDVPAAIDARVMARIARLPPGSPVRAAMPRRRERLAWSLTVIGLLVVLSLSVYELVVFGPIAAFGLFPFDRGLMPPRDPALPLLVVGLGLYLLGLFGQAGRGASRLAR